MMNAEYLHEYEQRHSNVSGIRVYQTLQSSQCRLLHTPYKKNKTQGRKTINSRSTSIVSHTEKNATFWEKIDEKLLILQKSRKIEKCTICSSWICHDHFSGLAVTFVTLVTLILFWLTDWLWGKYHLTQFKTIFPAHGIKSDNATDIEQSAKSMTAKPSTEQTNDEHVITYGANWRDRDLRMMPPPGLWMELQRRVTLTFDLLAPKLIISSFCPVHHVCRLAAKSVHYVCVGKLYLLTCVADSCSLSSFLRVRFLLDFSRVSAATSDSSDLKKTTLWGAIKIERLNCNVQ